MPQLHDDRYPSEADPERSWSGFATGDPEDVETQLLDDLFTLELWDDVEAMWFG